MNNETEKDTYGSLWCIIHGHHVGNVQWGAYGDRRQILTKCSCCYRFKKNKKKGKIETLISIIIGGQSEML